MRLTADRLRLVMDYGLTEYQARAYLALLESPMTTAGTLARLSHVPRNRLYGVLEDLQRMGLVDIHLNEKRQYSAKLFSHYLKKRVEGLAEEIETIQSREDYIDSVLAPAEPDPEAAAEVGSTRVLRGRRSITDELESMLARAKERVTLVLTANAAIRYEPSLRECVQEGEKAGFVPDIQVFLPAEAFQNGIAEKLNRVLPGCTHLLREPRSGLTLLVDENDVMFVHPVPDDTRGASTSDFAFTTTNPAFVADCAQDLANLARLADRPRAPPAEGERPARAVEETARAER